MFTFDKTDLQRFAVSALGAIAMTGASIVAAAGPAHAATPAPITVAEWTQQVERKLDTVTDAAALRMAPGTTAETMLNVRFTADGDYAGAGVARSSGDAAIDAHAVQVANSQRYPALPPALRGRPVTIGMRLVFGMANDAAQLADMRERVARPVTVAARAADRVALK